MLTTTPLGRETPFQLVSLGRTLLVGYQDGVAVFANGPEGIFQPEQEYRWPTEAVAVLGPAERSRIVLSGGHDLHVLDGSLRPLQSELFGGEEDVTALVDLDERSFLAVDEASGVTFWTRGEDGPFRAEARWTGDSSPLTGLVKGRTVLVEERGRLQERDCRNGTLLSTWPKTATAVWGVLDPSGSHLLTLDPSGHAHLWDASGRELMFSMELDFQAVRGSFRSGSLEGAILGSGGEAAVFKLVEGGATAPLAVPETPLVALAYHGPELIGVDENGGLWRLGGEEPVSCGGAWAGWATCSLYLNEARLFVGTAGGSVETFTAEGRRALPSLSLHRDAVVGLERWKEQLISVAADATVCRISNPAGPSPRVEPIEVATAGQSVVGYSLCPLSGLLWLGLEEGLVCWTSLLDGAIAGEASLGGRRIEEVQAAGPGAALVLTDRGSVRRIEVDYRPKG